ncbi:PREDICTED: uncharacterized protein LOC104763163 [Camelina sativa]|uniref:Uncharacterized protein LOC104763163 n=1 Tax=Camelina sativa TaxID=90675 RepID=A0ABM0XES8_CAMSA|nr:PREDICTED: uncharacterized protein LOC104763163 [Camelina sativa]
MSSIKMNQNSNMVQSMFTTSNYHHMNHANLFASTPSFSSYQNSHLSSSSFLFNMMRRNSDSASSVEYFPINTLNSTKYEIERVNSVMDSNPNIWIPVSLPPDFLGNQGKVLNPTPLNIVYPHHSAAPSHNSDMFASSSKQNHVPQDRRSLKKILKPTNNFDSEEDKKSGDGEYDGRTHSIPREKNGPYTCPKCNEVFDTSQKFASHMSLHYKSETNKERARRLRARNKSKYRKFMATLR